jgi:hypothetical protein
MKIFAPFRKVEAQDDGTIIVAGIASTEAIDADGEIIKASAIAAALPDFMRHGTGALREMHQLSAAGTVTSLDVQGGETLIEAHVVDPIAVKKVQAGVYKGFSVGGKVTARDAEMQKVITGVKLIEISLVDRPNNPDAVLTFWKVEGEDERDTLDIAKVEAMIARALAPLAGQNALLKAEIAALRAEPLPAKAVLRVVGKTGDGGIADDGFEPVRNADGSINEPATEMKKVHAAGPVRRV